MATSTDSSSQAATVTSEKNEGVDQAVGEDVLAPTPAQKHPRDGMPGWKWATTQAVILLMSLAYGEHPVHFTSWPTTH